MKEDIKKAGKNPQDCGSKCAGESKQHSGAQQQQKSAHESSKQQSGQQRSEQQQHPKKW